MEGKKIGPSGRDGASFATIPVPVSDFLVLHLLVGPSCFAHLAALKRLIGLAALVFAAGCGCGSGPSTGEGNPLDRSAVFRVAAPDFLPFGEALASEWAAVAEAEGSPLKLETVTLDYRALHAALFDGGGLAAGEFDAVLLHSDWLAQAHRSKLLVDLAPRIRRDGPGDYPDDFCDDLVALQQIDGAVLGLPYHDGLVCLVYQSDVFDDEMLRDVHLAKYGYPMQPPQTWADLGRLAAFLNRPEDYHYGTALPAEPEGPGPFWLLAAGVWSRGGELFDAGRVQLDTPEVAESLEFYRRLVGDRYAVHHDVRQLDLFAIGRTFVEGGLVMAVAPVGFAALGEVASESKLKGRVGVAPLPHGPDGPKLTLSSYWVLAVPAKGPNQDLAYRFVKHCAGKTADKARTLAGVLGCRRSTWADAEVRRALPFAAKLEDLHAMARSLPRRPDLRELAAVVNQTVIEAINSEGPLKPVIERAQKAADELPQ